MAAQFANARGGERHCEIIRLSRGGRNPSPDLVPRPPSPLGEGTVIRESEFPVLPPRWSPDTTPHRLSTDFPPRMSISFAPKRASAWDSGSRQSRRFQYCPPHPAAHGRDPLSPRRPREIATRILGLAPARSQRKTTRKSS
jgi:hypothetical protein